MDELTMRIGTPFVGADRQGLEKFLQRQGLDYDESITYTVLLESDSGIAACGSCHNNVIKCVAVDPAYRGQNLLGTVMTQLVAHLFEEGRSHYFLFTKPQNRELFAGMGLYAVESTDKVLLMENRRDGLERYIRQLKAETPAVQGGVGAVVANCNPFTKGHRWLVEQAAARCGLLHLFVLAQEQAAFTTAQRMAMVRAGVADLSNVLVHSASDYLISPAVFPTYFIKDKAGAFGINCGLDIRIFGTHIAPALGITRRFVGTEPSCGVTAQYNDCLKTELPDYGVAVTELPRLEIDGTAVSASTVRRALAAGDWQTVQKLTPETTWRYLQEVYR